jgi:glucose-1-phosphate thymidylyltransferase
MKCLILAGGFATRLYPLTLNKAKALLEYKGKPVITHIVDRIPKYIDIIVSTNKKFENDFINWRTTLSRNIEVCVEEAVNDDQKLGAVGAIDYWIKKKNIKEDILVIAGDNYAELDIGEFVGRFDRRTPLIAVFDVGDKEKACEIEKACQLGLVILDGNRVVRLDEKPPKATSSIIATGIYILPARIFPELSEYCRQKKQDNLGSFIGYLLQNEKVLAYSFTQTWLDIGDEIKRGRLSIQ